LGHCCVVDSSWDILKLKVKLMSDGDLDLFSPDPCGVTLAKSIEDHTYKRGLIEY